jgi:cytochrome c-type biogenesis protein CcmH/NrfG
MAIKLCDQGRLDEALERWRELVAVAPGNEEVRAEFHQALAMKRHLSASVRQ